MKMNIFMTELQIALEVFDHPFIHLIFWIDYDYEDFKYERIYK